MGQYFEKKPTVGQQFQRYGERYGNIAVRVKESR